RLPVVHSCNYIRQAAAGLKHAASRNMVHRDIKPQNIMLTAGGVIKILDFGLARLTERGDADEGLTSTGVLMGTADFIAPEQARDARNADLKSDIYSLGCTLYFLLVGQPPFPGGTYVEKVIAHCSEPFPDIRRIRDDVPDEVCTIISRMTAREPGERYQTARELIEALTPFSQRTDKSIKTGTAGPPPNGGNAVGVEHDETKIEQRSPIPNVISKETPSASGSKASIPIIGAALAGFLLLCGVVWIFAGDFFPGSEPVQPQAGGSDVYVPESDAPHVLIVLSADKFWYSDFGPLQQTLQENNFRWTVTSNRSGQASYDRTDSIPGKQDVSIEQSIVDLSNGDGLSEFDAIVFMGNSIEEFIADDDVGVAVADVLNKLDDGNAWITGIGRGVNIPAYHGFYDGDEIADSQWIIPAARQASEFIGINERVVVDEDARVLTAREWHDATDFARQLVTQLRSSHLNR
ncbi:MAG: protein kinase, partial [Planctomycetota bacterium]